MTTMRPPSTRTIRIAAPFSRSPFRYDVQTNAVKITDTGRAQNARRSAALSDKHLHIPLTVIQLIFLIQEQL
ncbi:MAG: hypothetical protein V8Q79_11265 [Christensenellales bacterium]